MVKFCVTTDSGCDLPATFCKERSIYAYPMKYTLENTEYQDMMDPKIVLNSIIKCGTVPCPYQSNDTF